MITGDTNVDIPQEKKGKKKFKEEKEINETPNTDKQKENLCTLN